MNRAVIAAAVVLLAAAAPAAGPALRLTPSDLWKLPAIGGGAGTSGVAGIRTRLLSGHPDQAGPYTIMLSVPAHVRIAAHRHRDDRVASVVSGTWYFGYGDHARDGATKPLPAGSFYTEPGGRSHFARTGAEPVVLFIHGNGPTDTRYTEAATGR